MSETQQKDLLKERKSMHTERSFPMSEKGGMQLVMVVDDDPTLRAIELHTLETDGWQVLEAGDGETAIELYQRYRPHIVLMDAIMTGMDGFEACRQIVDMAGDGESIVIMVTALNDERSLGLAYEAGAEDYIVKPIHWALLRKRVQYLSQALHAEKNRRQAEEQLRQSSKMQAISRLTGGIAHDFNNILASLLGYTELAQGQVCALEGEPAKKIDRYLQEVNASGQRAKKLIQDMLAYTRNEANKPQLMRAEELIEDVMTVLQTVLPRTVEVQHQFADDLPLVNMDLAHFNQVLMHLCINARDAMHEHGHLVIGLRKVSGRQGVCASCRESAEGDFLEVMVKDDGSGIDKEDMQHIFDLLYSTHEIGSATGLRLSVVHDIVHEHGGHIIVETDPEQGTAVRLLFPIYEGQVPTGPR